MPGSVHLQKLAQGERNPVVRYSFLAGDKGIVSADAIRVLHDALTEKELSLAFTETARRIALEQVNEVLSFSSGTGGGAVTLESATLPGGMDRDVLHHHHLKFLPGQAVLEAGTADFPSA